MKCVQINKNAMILILVLVSTYRVVAQDTIHNTSISFRDCIGKSVTDKTYKLDYKHLIAPVIFIGLGIVSLESDGLKQLNFSTRDEISENQPKHISLDNYTKYAPAVMVYGLNARGVILYPYCDGSGCFGIEQVKLITVCEIIG